MTYVKSNAGLAAIRMAAWLVVAACTATGAQPQDQPQALPTVELTAGMHKVRAQLARTPEQRQIGLMWRREMPASDGMLFVFEQAGPQCFWMKNTLLALSIAFLSDDGTVVNIDDMAPQTLDPHCSAKPVRYVLEMNKGWFASRGIKAGAKVSGAPIVKAP